jgi:hypothetical protein
MVGSKNLEISQLIAQAKFVVGLELATMAVSTDTLKVFPTVWIASLQCRMSLAGTMWSMWRLGSKDLRRYFLNFPL